MKTFFYKLRFAYRNLTGKNILFSLAILTLLVILLALLTAMTSHRAMIEKILYYQARDEYLNTDIIVTYDENSPIKIINKRNLKEKYQEYLDYSEVFFNFSTIAQKDDPFYVSVFASENKAFSNIIDYPAEEIGKGEAIITKSAADENGINVGSTIFLYISNIEYEFTVNSVISDRGLFRGNTVFVLKEYIFRDIIGSGTDNLGNTIYARVKTGIDVQTVIELLRQDEEYGKYVINPAIDYEYINHYVRYGSSMFMAVGVVVTFSIILIMRSVFTLYFKDFNAQYAIVNILGGSRIFVFSVWVYQLMILSAICLPFSIFICNYVFNIAAGAFLVNSLITIPFIHILFAFIIFVFVIAYELFLRYRLLRSSSLISLSREQTVFSDFRYLPLVAAVLAFIGNNIFNIFGPGVKALLNIVLILIMATLVLRVLLRFVCRLLERNKTKSIFNVFNVKHLYRDRIVGGILKVMMISLILVGAILTINRAVNNVADGITQTIKGDYVLGNIYNYTPELKQQILLDYPVHDVDEAVLLRYVYINDYNEGIPFFVSLDYDNIGKYYELNVDNDIREKFLSSDKLYILLPESFQYIYHTKTGDELSLKLNSTDTEVRFTVAGFFIGDTEHFIFSNYKQVYGNDAVNSLMINKGHGFTDKDKTAIIKRYAGFMYVLLDIKKTTALALQQGQFILNMLMVVFLNVFIGFIIIIINNMLLKFSIVKKDYVRLKILGMGNGRLMGNIIKEAFLTVFISSFVAFISLLLLFPNFPSLMLLYGFYKNLPVDVFRLLAYVGVGALAFVFSYIVYFLKIKNVDLTTIKN